MADTHVALVGLAVMGSNLARNIERNGFPVVVYNRSSEITQEFVRQYSEQNFIAAQSLREVVSKTSSPRQIILMIKAGKPVDSVLAELLPLLSPGDIVLDGGNSAYQDTMRRSHECSTRGIHFLGVGISGGEEGALHGPSIMPGGVRDAWQIVEPMLKKIAAQVGSDPCCSYIGPDGSGHFVKMVHNGIEYGDMQLIAEAYDLLSSVTACQPPELADIFARWNGGPLRSFLIEITADIFRKTDQEVGGYLVDHVLDKAGQKGTGRWTVEAALELGVPIP
ncbi:MAG: NADP-dependent phosphogluconate dehydrogenase, partial [Bdellovibrionales bacterium]|nr:NADP-dependent phosphogluconate dehydrogenase [Bdellovibrionales bacterium]